ncbi:iron-containing alcohol dehydrogenase [Kitasatospora sp. NPDC057500]|uniref:iron-containing alcohol dehydrogenase n=1 Tax=Kitasatospora sp. NPDC057500 TaxID=3346151 RepID=UPI00368F5D48
MTCTHLPDLDNAPFGVLRLPRGILVGAGQLRALPHIVRDFGTSVLICTDPRLAASDELRALVTTLEEQGLEVAVFGDTEAELPVPGIMNCVEAVRGRRIDAVIGFGGGSCMDMAKVVAVLLAHGGTPSDYYGEFAVPGPVLPVIAVPTTAGTGSEATAIAVVSDPALGMKTGISSPHIIPAAAVCDPTLTLTCPPALTAATGADAFVHLVESYTAVARPGTPELARERVFIGRNPLTDTLAIEGVRLVGRSLVRAYREPGDESARGDMMLAALYGGMALSNAGTAAAHAIQYPVGTLTHTPHGVGVGLLLPYVLRHNFPAIRPQLARIAEALGADVRGLAVEDAARAGVEAVDRILAEIGIPATLAELGVREDDLGLIAERARNSRRLIDNNPVPLGLEGLTAITRAAFAGDRAFRA